MVDDFWLWVASHTQILVQLLILSHALGNERLWRLFGLVTCILYNVYCLDQQLDTFCKNVMCTLCKPVRKPSSFLLATLLSKLISLPVVLHQ